MSLTSYERLIPTPPKKLGKYRRDVCFKNEESKFSILGQKVGLIFTTTGRKLGSVDFERRKKSALGMRIFGGSLMVGHGDGLSGSHRW